ncbi:methylmalonyl Co-A mutase-associated GTPase MeaB [Jatrophihabitans sp. YIM 134969]
MSPAPDPVALADGVRAGERAAVARAITLVESRRAEHRALAQELLRDLLPDTGHAVRVGISGVPGVGKSTFIDALGNDLLTAGHRVAVLAVDPSSRRTGGSILGDKTRMGRLAVSPDAFVRPSPSAGTLGGVAQATRESMIVVEAAGYDVVLVETVGVGQSEYVVADMVDTFLFLTLARTGDSLQGMKRGILELADVIAVNKADGPHVEEAQRAARELSAALRLVRGPDDAWQPPVVTCSAAEGTDLDRVWKHVTRHREWLSEDGLRRRRADQRVAWTRAMVRDRLLARLDDVRPTVDAAEAAVRRGEVTAVEAADDILRALDTLR